MFGIISTLDALVEMIVLAELEAFVPCKAIRDSALALPLTGCGVRVQTYSNQAKPSDYLWPSFSEIMLSTLRRKLPKPSMKVETRRHALALPVQPHYALVSCIHISCTKEMTRSQRHR
jgi:hypothetical protein